jgi:hypothetical protein
MLYLCGVVQHPKAWNGFWDMGVLKLSEVIKVVFFFSLWPQNKRGRGKLRATV